MEKNINVNWTDLPILKKTKPFTYRFVFDGFDADGINSSAKPDDESIYPEIESRFTNTNKDRRFS